MDVAALAGAILGAQMGNSQMAIAAKMMKMNANHATEIVQMIQAGQENLGRLAATAPGVGQNLDITV